MIILFTISLITHIIGIYGCLRKSLFCLSVFALLILLEAMIFFAAGLLICAFGDIISLSVCVFLMVTLQYRRQSAPKTSTPKPVNPSGGETGIQNYSYLDNNPPDYNSIVFHKPLAPPEYQSVELMPVRTVSSNNLQKY